MGVYIKKLNYGLHLMLYRFQLCDVFFFYRILKKSSLDYGISYPIFILVVTALHNIYWVLYIHHRKINIKCYLGNQLVQQLWIESRPQTTIDP